VTIVLILLRRVQRVKVDGVLVKQGVAVITSFDDSEEPSFGVVDSSPTGTSTVWFGLRELQLIEFQANFTRGL